MQSDLWSVGDKQLIELPGASLCYYPDFIADQQAVFQQLLDEVDWQQENLLMCGKLIPVPRLQAWYGDEDANYSYSGLAMAPQPWLPLLLDLKQRLDTELGVSFNSVLANLYRDGNDSVSWHSDDEPELGRNPLIASLSLGATRRFSLRHKRSKAVHHLDLVGGSLLVMSGETQHTWHHQIAKTASCDQPRINLTFRRIIDRP